MSFLAVAMMFAVQTTDVADPETEARDITVVGEATTTPEAEAEDEDQRIVCKRPRHSVGSRIGGQRKTCKTVAQWEAERAAAQDLLREAADRQPAGSGAQGPSIGGAGG